MFFKVSIKMFIGCFLRSDYNYNQLYLENKHPPYNLPIFPYCQPLMSLFQCE